MTLLSISYDCIPTQMSYYRLVNDYLVLPPRYLADVKRADIHDLSFLQNLSDVRRRSFATDCFAND